MIKNLDILSNDVLSFYTKVIPLNEPFISFASRFAGEKGTVVLLSGNSSSDCNKYNILGCYPWLYFFGKNNKMSININGKTNNFKADPLDTLEHLLKTYNTKDLEKNVPIKSGLMGYLAYDLKNNLEKLPLTTIDEFCLPDICLFAPSVIVVNEVSKNTARLFFSQNKYSRQENIFDRFYKKLNTSFPVKNSFSIGKEGYKSNLSRDEYMSAVKKIKEYISEGHIYQANLSQQFKASFKGNSFAFFEALYYLNPASFFSYVNAVDHQIISTSPERLIKQRGRKVETRPIKGTRPRGKTLKIDKLMRDELLASQKDDAELSMIVDLLRNDLGKVCKVDSVNVCEHKRLEAYQNVYHLVSIIKGKLSKSKNSVDLIRAIFPGGSITGCPKIRSMEIIDELEINSRHIYTGSIGYISFHSSMDLSVAIRTATISNNFIQFSVGSGIVYDSNPEEEFNETLHKGETFMKFFKNPYKARRDSEDKKSYIWANGILKPSCKVTIPFDDLGIIYGFGIFETLRVENGKIQLLEKHIERLNTSWAKLFKTPTPNLTWEKIILQVVKVNRLDKHTSVVKIVVTKGQNSKKGMFSGMILVTANLYKKRLYNGKESFKVAVYPFPRESPLADHKTLNYMYYYLAGLWATERGFDESIILNPDGTISEGNSSNILLVYDTFVVLPTSKFVLKGVMVYAVINQLRKMNYDLITRPVKQAELFKAHAVFLTNSLIGMVPVSYINNRLIPYNLKLARTINEEILK